MKMPRIVTLVQGSHDALINAPLKTIDSAKWFFTLKAADYAACSSGHNGMVQGRLPDGKRVAVSVETIGGDFTVNNFLEDVAHCITCAPCPIPSLGLGDRTEFTWHGL